MFVTDAPTPAAASTRSSRLIGLVRGLIDYARELTAILQAPRVETQHFRITRAFGTLNIDLILARIARGLWLAVALEKRLVRGAAHLDAPPRPAATVAATPVTTATAAAPRTKPPRAPVRPAIEDDAALLARFPTAKEITAMARGRAIGVVITDICHDLGIDTSHPLWRGLHEAIYMNGGSLVRLVRNLLKRHLGTNFYPPDMVVFPPMPHRRTAETPWPSFAAATGPP